MICPPTNRLFPWRLANFSLLANERIQWKLRRDSCLIDHFKITLNFNFSINFSLFPFCELINEMKHFLSLSVSLLPWIKFIARNIFEENKNLWQTTGCKTKFETLHHAVPHQTERKRSDLEISQEEIPKQMKRRTNWKMSMQILLNALSWRVLCKLYLFDVFKIIP